MNDGLIPQRYALALYKYALENGHTEKVYEEMKQVISSFDRNPELMKVMQNPFVSKEDKDKLLRASAGDQLEDCFERFLNVIFNHKREAFVYYMACDYLKIYRKENKIAKVVITTASPLSDEEMKRLRDLVQKAYKDMTLEFEYKTDPDIIGGFIIDVDSVRMNASISNELEQLRQNLLRK